MTPTGTGYRYDDTRDHLRDEFRRADVLLRRHLEACWSEETGSGSGVGGYFVSDEEVDRLLHVPDRPERSEDVRSRDSELTRLLRRVTATVRSRETRSIDAGVDLRLCRLAAEYGLTPLERDVLVLTLVPDVDRKYEKVYGYFRDDITNVRPTVGLIRRVLARPDTDPLSLVGVLDSQSTLRSERLVELIEGPTIPSSEVRVRSRVIAFLLGDDAVADSIAPLVDVVEPQADLRELTLGDRHRERLFTLAGRLDSEREDSDEQTTTTPSSTDRSPLPPAFNDSKRSWLCCAFTGPDEQTASMAVEGLCAAVGTSFLRVEARSLGHRELPDELAAIRREARLRQTPVHLAGVEALIRNDPGGSTDDESSLERRSDRERLETVLSGLDLFPGDVFLTGDVPITAAYQPRLVDHRLVQVEFPRPDFARRRAIWDGLETVPDDVNPATIAGLFRLTRGQIEDAMATAASLADGSVTADDVTEACRMHSQADLDHLAQRLEPTADWDEIVLPNDTLAHLREVAAQIRHRGTVYEGWGFEDRFSLGNGINLLFTGPSGTGKTMATEIIAGDVGLPLYKLDLSSILSKYIGETEKNLGRVFDQAEHSNAILFFDEADALFGKRTEIGDSRDRYANVEVDYLLQRMEEHDGCVVMATNLQENIDDAFKRRINATVEFPMPDEEARRRIWGLIFPEETPLGELDVDYLARFELSGGSIKNVTLTASFMAAADGEAVKMSHLVRALRREFQKIGKLYGPETFGEYEWVIA